jgi:hypothetical protein
VPVEREVPLFVHNREVEVSIDGDKSFATRTEQELTGPQEGALTGILTELNHLLQGHCEVVPSAVRVAVEATKSSPPVCGNEAK